MLHFIIIAKGGISDPYADVNVWWEVSNGGVDDDNKHQEIYYKSKDEKPLDKMKFDRMVSYKGRHLLKCRLKNKVKHIDITKVFVVNGCK